jgi:cyclophilin family peptidyl-prolyl cis-trans isomerase/protein-disulfide isomerase
MTRKPLISCLSCVLLISALAACRAIPAATPQATSSIPAKVPPTQSATDQGSSCTVVSEAATPSATETSPFAPVSAQDWTRGPADAAITFLEYSDFQCPYCAKLEPVMDQLLKTFPNDLRVVYRHFPLAQHDKAVLGAQAAEAAGLQGKFWEMHDLLFTHQADWQNQTPAQFEVYLASLAASLSLNPDQFAADLHGPAVTQKVQAAGAEATRLGLNSTPTLIINGKQYTGPGDYENLASVVSLLLLGKKQFSACPAMTIDPHKEYTATIKTAKGDIVVRLLPEQAPIAVNSFVFLASHGWYDGVTFHRVIPGFIAQAGDPSGTGFGNPGYEFDNEISSTLKFDQPGQVGLANVGPGTNGSQFFITYAAEPTLNGKYTLFGQVVQGMDIAQKLTPRDPSKGNDLPAGDEIISITIEAK